MSLRRELLKEAILYELEKIAKREVSRPRLSEILSRALTSPLINATLGGVGGALGAKMSGRSRLLGALLGSAGGLGLGALSRAIVAPGALGAYERYGKLPWTYYLL